MYFSCIQLARLRNSMILKAADALDFQRDMFGSIDTLLCKRQTDANSTKMPFTSRSPRSMHYNMANSMGNNSGKCCSKQLHMQMSHCSCVLIMCLHCSLTIVYVVMPGNGQNCSHLFRKPLGMQEMATDFQSLCSQRSKAELCCIWKKRKNWD